MRLTVVAVLILTSIGCGRSDRESQLSNSLPTRKDESKKDVPKIAEVEPIRKHSPPTNEKSPEPKNPKLEAFRVGMLRFIAEAHSVARAAELAPSQATYKRKMDQLEEEYSRIPEPPPGTEGCDEMLLIAKKTVDVLRGHSHQLAARDELLRLGAVKEAAEMQKKSIETMKEFRVILDGLLTN